MKTRIVKEVRGDGSEIFYPQFRLFGIWCSFTTRGLFQHKEWYRTYDGALKFLDNERKIELKSEVVKREYLST